MITDPATFAFQFEELDIRADILHQMMGYEKPELVPEPVADSIQEAIDLAPSISDIRGGYVISEPVEVSREKKMIMSHGESFYTEKIVTHQLRRSEKFAWFVCTAGEEISKRTRELMKKGDLINGYAIDVLANAIVETAMDRIQESLETRMNQDRLKITNRYSPGYCNWDIAEQDKLFKAFPDNFLGIALTPSCLMIPIKSVSGIIGIGKEVRFNAYTCNLCSDENCIYRRIR